MTPRPPWTVLATVWAVTMLLPMITLAQATVDGTEISWPDNGWYQVQDATSLASICEGGSNCRVTPGRYIVINHSTGERFIDIEVVEDNPSSATVNVTGSVISWPDDGWYQVQDAYTFESLCEGTRRCQVPAGSYTIINHTTQTRYENIEVTGSATSVESQSTVSVAGNTISWTTNGWYQVQSSNDYRSLCEGGLSCTVPAGSYIVINHDTGDRFDIVVVESDTSASTAGMSVVGRLGHERVLELAEIWLEGGNLSLLDTVNELETRLAEIPNDMIVFDGDVARYQCPSSGSASTRDDDRNRTFFVLEQCFTNGRGIDGSYHNFVAGGRLQFGSETTRGRRYDQLSITDVNAPGGSLDITGTLSNSTGSSTNIECIGTTFINSRSVSLEAVIDVSAGTRTELDNLSLSTSTRSGRRRGITPAPEDCIDTRVQSVRGQVRVTSDILGDVTADVQKTQQIERDLQDYESDTATGSLIVEFSDGSSVIVTLLSSRDNLAQIDIVADGAVQSLVAPYIF